MSTPRTDLAAEAEALYRRGSRETGELPGVRSATEERDGCRVCTVEVLDGRGEEALGKPAGKYVTLELDSLLRREENAFERTAKALSSLLRELLPLNDGDAVLVAGLGNRAITPDSVGPLCVEGLLVTRHLKREMPEQFRDFRPVSAVCAGVLGSTGLESAELVKAVSSAVAPAALIAVDALASASMARLCRTVQLTDAGIVPGSGVGNSRAAISKETAGVPVIAVGVPTVVDAATITSELAEQAGTSLPEGALDGAPNMMVTPRDIDSSVREISRLVAYGLNLALHEGLTVGDVDMLLG